MQSSAKLRYARVSPQKARLVANLVRGRDVPEAIEMLTYVQKKSAPIIRKLLEAAVASAEQTAEQQDVDLDIDRLFVRTIFVDQGPSLRRFRPRAQGRATRIQKKTSHITVQLDVRDSEDSED